MFSVVLSLAGCASQQQLDELAARVATLEEKAAQQKPGAPPAPAASQEDITAANALLGDAQKALQAADYDTAKAKLAELQSKFPSTPAAKSAAKLMTDLSVVGQTAAPLEVEKWYQGNTTLDQNDATVLVFWELWCPHCKREMPKMQPLAEKWQARGVQFVGLTKVTKSATEEGVAEFIQTNGIKFPMAKEKDGSLSKAYGVSGVPAAAMVKNGKVIWRGHPARLTDELIEQHLSRG